MPTRLDQLKAEWRTNAIVNNDAPSASSLCRIVANWRRWHAGSSSTITGISKRTSRPLKAGIRGPSRLRSLQRWASPRKSSTSSWSFVKTAPTTRCWAMLPQAMAMRPWRSSDHPESMAMFHPTHMPWSIASHSSITSTIRAASRLMVTTGSCRR